MNIEMPQRSLLWVGHATALVDIGGFRVLTDPLLRRRVIHLKRRSDAPPPPPVEPDVVLISHAHMDHLHVPSLRMIDTSVPIVVPRGTARLLRRTGFDRVIEVVPDDRIEVGPAVIDVIRAEHGGGRGPHRRIESRPVGYVVEVNQHRTYFAGDTDLFDEMGDLGRVDLALLPIWGWGPTIGVGHLDPERAAQATELIRPGLVVPIHWGTFMPENFRRRAPTWLDEPAREFERLATDAAIAPVQVLRPGTSTTLRT